uniref:Uncharacterized protein n=1 Tax=Arundo donax TaxID=35708 RepID=A0A0A9AM07_ARUDO
MCLPFTFLANWQLEEAALRVETTKGYYLLIQLPVLSL